MPRRVSEISCFSNIDIACAKALNELGWTTGTVGDPKTMTDGQEFAHFIEAYCRRPMVRSAYTLVPVKVDRRRAT